MDETPGTDETARYSSRRQYLIIGSVVASTFFVGFGGGVIFPILPNLGDVLGISPFLVGFILSANRFSRLLASAPAGGLVDRVGTRTPFIAGLLVQSVGTFGYVVAMVAPLPEAWFLLARIVWGLGSALVFATAYTIAADVSGADSRGTSMGLIRGGSIFGFPTGLVLGGVVSELAGIRAAFLVATAFSLLASVMAALTVPETHVTDTREAVAPWNVDTSVTTIIVGLVNFAVLFAYIGALFATLVQFLSVHGIGVLGFDAQGSSGIFMAVTVLAAATFMFAGGYVSDRTNSRVPTLLVFLLVSFVGFVLLAGASSAATLTVACLFIGAGQGGTSGPLMALLADLTPDERMGRASGTTNVLGDVGGGLGPLLSVPLVDALGFPPVYAACAIMPLVAGGILLVGIYRETGALLPATREQSGASESLDD
ncbi:MFS transporter [Natrialba aegyptia]|uniref:Major facilitator superfamily protein n=1 Tax=Natrialba aegyptia DSM 13077 TaxID=1227491 RepID=M0B7S2_9EURY|nr:MFS transporter [Natrialba aegyptia]ELZ06961.1 major facilitator superfamily protein [Natrialba aegyptia DSM 13077]